MNWTNHIEDYLEGTLPLAEKMRMDEAIAEDRELKREVNARRDLQARLEGKRLRQLVKRHAGHRISEASRRARRIGFTLIALVGFLTGMFLLTHPLWRSSHDTPTGNQPKMSPGTDIPLPADSLARPDTMLQVPMATIPSVVQPSTPRIVLPDPVREAIFELEIPDFVLMGRTDDDLDSLGSRRGFGQVPKDAQEKRWLSACSDAIGALRSGQPSQAILHLQTLPDELPALYRDEIEWILTLCYLAESHPKADSLLKTITQDPNHSYRIAALQLKARLQPASKR